jgi:hypothetical protein
LQSFSMRTGASAEGLAGGGAVSGGIVV